MAFVSLSFLFLLSGRVYGESGGAPGSTSRHGLGDECNRLSTANYSVILWPGDPLTLKCPKECTPPDSVQWHHAFNRNDILIYIASGDFESAITDPPRRTDVGYICCGCPGGNPEEQCCVGVAYAPKVTTFTTTQNNTNVTGTHVGNNITMTCEAHGYPDLQLEINGPIAFQNSTHKPRPYDNWYLKRRAFLLSNLTEGYSGEYTCEASIQVTQGGETAAIKGGERPSAYLFQKDSADDDEVTFICDVECSVAYNISWLHNDTVIEATQDGKYQQYHNDSKNELVVRIMSEGDKGRYTCVVNTVYHKNEARWSIGFKVPFTEYVNIVNNKGPVEEHKTASNGADTSTVIWAVGVPILGFVVVAAIACIFIIIKQVRKRTTKPKSDDTEMIMRPADAESRHESGDDERDGPPPRLAREDAPLMETRLERKGLGAMARQRR